MAAKKSAQAVPSPTFERVVVSAALASAESRARFFAAMGDLDDSGIVDLVMRHVRAERGVWLRQGRSWPAVIRKVAARSVQLAALLEELMRHVQGMRVDNLPATFVQGHEKAALGLLQALLDVVIEETKDWLRMDRRVMSFSPVSLVRPKALRGCSPRAASRWPRALGGAFGMPSWE